MKTCQLREREAGESRHLLMGANAGQIAALRKPRLAFAINQIAVGNFIDAMLLEELINPKSSITEFEYIRTLHLIGLIPSKHYESNCA